MALENGTALANGHAQNGYKESSPATANGYHGAPAQDTQKEEELLESDPQLQVRPRTPACHTTLLPWTACFEPTPRNHQEGLPLASASTVRFSACCHVQW